MPRHPSERACHVTYNDLGLKFLCRHISDSVSEKDYETPMVSQAFMTNEAGVKHTFKNLVPSVLTGQTLQGVDFRGFSGRRSYR